jgi:hypothetical protein
MRIALLRKLFKASGFMIETDRKLIFPSKEPGESVYKSGLTMVTSEFIDSVRGNNPI